MALCVLFASPARAAPRPAAPAAGLAAARACADRADSACVVRALSAHTPTAAEAAEHHLLLAFAYARLGRHPQAQAAFKAWIALGNRLDRAQAPGRVWNDYAAALLAHLGGALDLRPQVERKPAVPRQEVSWRELPAVPPPPRSGRDQARDVALVLGPSVGSTADPAGLAVGIDVLVGLTFKQRWRLGLGVMGISLATSEGGARGLLAGLGVQAGYALVVGASSQLRVSLRAGGGMLQRPVAGQSGVAVIEPGVSWTWLPSGAPLGVELRVSDRVLLGGDAVGHVAGLTVGLALQPGGRGEAR